MNLDRSECLGPSKQIRGAGDLAINGAVPAYGEPLHVGRPNVGPKVELLELMDQVMERRWLTNNGPLVQELEARIARQLGVRNCVVVCNGTVALEIAIRALGLTGEVIVPAYTFIATAHALEWQGLVPVFADIDPGTHNVDPASVERCIGPHTSGIIGVHLWGRPAPVDDLESIARKYGLALMFDAAHAFGCAFRGRKIGGFGRCEVFSFHATKIFNTFEGGAVTTDDDELAEQVRLMRNFGFRGYDNVVYPGTNGKMSEASAAMGLVNLDALDGFVQGSRATHEAYLGALEPIAGVDPLRFDPECDPNFHYMVVEVEGDSRLRDRVVDALHAENILARKYFWPGCHRMEPYRSRPAAASPELVHTEAVSGRVVVLPAGPRITAQDVAVIAAVIDFTLHG